MQSNKSTVCSLILLVSSVVGFADGQTNVFGTLSDAPQNARQRQDTYSPVSTAGARVDPYNRPIGFGPSAAAATSGNLYLEARIAQLEDQINSLQVGNQFVENQCGPVDCSQYCCGSNGGFYLGGGLVFARPNFKEAFQLTQTNIVTGQQTLVPFSYDFEETPLAWLGYKMASGMGLKASYWQFDGSGQDSFNTADGMNIYGAHAITIIFPANIFAMIPGESLATQNSLATEIFNLYGTFDMAIQGVEITGGLGLRYVNLEQIIAAQVLSGGAPIRSLNWSREYEGLGPAISIDVKKRLGNSPFSVFTNAGGAFLFGTKNLNRTVLGDQSPQPASPFLSLQDADEVVGVGELAIGLEWARQLANGSQFLLRGSYEGSLWAESGAPTLGFLGFEGFGVTAEIKR